MADPEETGSEAAQQATAGEAVRSSPERARTAEQPNYDRREEAIPLKRRPAGPPLDPSGETRSRERPEAQPEQPEGPVDPV